jgi:hypothetical protein
MDTILGSSRETDRILVLGDFNLPKVEWGVQEDGFTLLPMGIMTNLGSDMVEGMLCCDLGQISSIPTLKKEKKSMRRYAHVLIYSCPEKQPTIAHAPDQWLVGFLI